jgi:selenocysteine lyase/cysteine desulfurase
MSELPGGALPGAALRPPKLGDRSLFPDLEHRAYLSHAAISPPSLLVQRAIEQGMARQARGGVDAFFGHLEQRSRLKQKLARLIGAHPDEIALVLNTTVGVIDVAQSLPWQRGDRVLLIEGEFPANVTPWQRAAQRFELELEWLPPPSLDDDGEWLAALAAKVDGARLLAVSAVQFQTGLRMPLEAIGRACRGAGCELFVDAIQGLGAVPIDVRRDGIDYLSAGGHKWLMGPEGTGVLYARRECAARLRPDLAGWISHLDAFEFLSEGEGHLRYDRGFKATVELFEQGMANTLGCLGLEASVDAIAELGVHAIFEHVARYNDALEEQLPGLTSVRAPQREHQSGILSFRPPAGTDAMQLHRSLGEQGISCTTPDGLLRFAPHWPNALSEIPAVVEAVETALR